MNNTVLNNEGDWDDATWVLTSSFIIITMQSGFGLLESGLVSNNNQKEHYDKKYNGYFIWWIKFLDIWIYNYI